MIKMLTVLVSTISDSQVFLRKKYEQKLLRYFSKNIAISDRSFNDTLANNIISFEQLNPDSQPVCFVLKWVDQQNLSTNTIYVFS